MGSMGPFVSFQPLIVELIYFLINLLKPSVHFMYHQV
jgi:hypothetical protein